MRRRSGLARDERGITVIEFAIVLPVMITLIMGMCELAYQGYMQSTLEGALQKAGRDSTIQAADDASIDQRVMQQVWQVSKNATYTSQRQSYSQFGNIAPEYFWDTAGTGVYDSTKDCFMDVNGNGVWDADPGTTGGGGASDVAKYSITVTYPRLFPVARLFGWPNTKAIVATTILKNQPYSSQNAYTPTKICPAGSS